MRLRSCLLLLPLTACRCEEPLHTAGGALLGSFCAPGGAPLGGSRVQVDTSLGPRQTTTDARGEWSLLDVAPGPVVVTVSAPAGERVLRAEVTAGERTVVEDPACAQRFPLDAGPGCPDYPLPLPGPCDQVDAGPMDSSDPPPDATRADGADPADGGGGPAPDGAADAAVDPDGGGAPDAPAPSPLCPPGTTRACYPGPAASLGVGPCRAGVELCAADGSGFGPCSGAITPGAEQCGDGVDQDCSGADEACPPVELPLFLVGDCVTASCPPAAPFPVACNILMSPGDPRGCVANAPGSPVVFFKAGDECDQGLVLGSLWCADTPGPPLGPANCPINKPQPMWVTSPQACPQ